MPNWVHNTVKVKASDWENFVKDTVNDKGDFDFNKIIPLSKDLNIRANSSYKKITEPYHVDLYAKDIKFQMEHVDSFLDKFYNDTITQKEFVDNVSAELKKATNKKTLQVWREKYGEYKYHPNSEFEGTIDFGRSALYPELLAGYFNVRRHGYPDWYSAQIAQWDTKWNASDCYIDEQNCIISFDTAWSMPQNIYLKLSEKYDFVVAFADEDIGSNYGLVKYSECEETPIISSWGELASGKSGTKCTAEALACRFEDLENYISWFEEDELKDTREELEKEFDEANKKILALF